MATFYCLIGLLLLSFTNVVISAKGKHSQETYGVVLLDSITFPKIVPSPNNVVLVLVTNKAYIGDYGTDSIRSEYLNFAVKGETLGNSENVLFTQIIVNGAENLKLVERIGVSPDFKHPLLFLYQKNSMKPIQFPITESFHSITLTNFVTKYAEFFYGINGLIESYNKFATRFIKNIHSIFEQKIILNESELYLNNLQTIIEKENALYYIKIMKNCIAKGTKFFINDETIRLEKLIQSKKTSELKLKELNKRLNILKQFHLEHIDL